jgi:hypothetical protein
LHSAVMLAGDISTRLANAAREMDSRASHVSSFMKKGVTGRAFGYNE